MEKKPSDLLRTFDPPSDFDGGHTAGQNGGPDDVDLFRDTALRYMGYANEVGEAFRPIVPRLVLPSYGVSGLYVLADTVSQASKARKDPTQSSLAVALTSVDALIWQTFASVLCPGLFINRTVYFSGLVVGRLPVPAAARRWAPVAVGLATIPFIVQPIDTFVSSIMNKTFRKWTGLPQHPL